MKSDGSICRRTRCREFFPTTVPYVTYYAARLSEFLFHLTVVSQVALLINSRFFYTLQEEQQPCDIQTGWDTELITTDYAPIHRSFPSVVVLLLFLGSPNTAAINTLVQIGTALKKLLFGARLTAYFPPQSQPGVACPRDLIFFYYGGGNWAQLLSLQFFKIRRKIKPRFLNRLFLSCLFLNA